MPSHRFVFGALFRHAVVSDAELSLAMSNKSSYCVYTHALRGNTKRMILFVFVLPLSTCNLISNIATSMSKKGEVAPVLSKALLHEDVWGSGCIEPQFPHVGAGER
jgi:hypothetical protein